MQIRRVEKVSDDKTEIELQLESTFLKIDVHSDNVIQLYSPKPINVEEQKTVNSLQISIEQRD